MEVLDAIFTRRSIRQFENRPVPEELIEKLLRAAIDPHRPQQPALAVHYDRRP